MKKIWEVPDRSVNRRAEEYLKNLKPSFRKRIDPVMLATFIGVFALFTLIWGVSTFIADRYGLFTPPPIQPVKDNRILINVRDELNTKPILDAAFHAPDNQLYILQNNNLIHHYNPETKLWYTENTKTETSLRNPQITMLRSINGTDPLSNQITPKNSSSLLWGLSEGNGLIRREDNQWQITIGDSIFTSGPKHTPISHHQLTSAAVSKDREWLLVGTNGNSIGIYNIKQRQWVTVQHHIYKELPSKIITHITYWKNRFWIGTPSGMLSIQINKNTPQLKYKPYFKGAILDLDVDPQNRLWILEANKSNKLSMLSSPNAEPKTIIDEKNIYHNLKAGDLQFARQWGNHLILAGEAGLFSYDTQYHSWKCHLEKSVLSFLPLPDQKGFYFGYSGGVGILQKDKYEPWLQTPQASKGKHKDWLIPIQSEGIVKLHFGQNAIRYSKNNPEIKLNTNHELLAFSRSGKVYSIKNNKNNKRNIQKIYESQSTALNPNTFKSAFAFGNNVLFTGPEGALVHNIVKRTYKDIPKKQLPKWLLKPDLTFITSGNATYIVSPQNKVTDIYRIATKDAANADFKTTNPISTTAGTIYRIKNWNNQGVVIIAGQHDGQVFRIDNQIHPLTGGGLYPSSIGSTTPLLDVAPYKDGLMAATRLGLYYYNQIRRSWKKYDLPAQSTPIEITNVNNQILTVSTDGKLFQIKTPRTSEQLIGGSIGIDITDNQVSDVMQVNGNLYIAGKGKIFLYNPDKRAVTRKWDLPGIGSVKLKGVSGNLPIALCDSRATIGAKTIDPNAGSVFNLSVDTQYIWTVRVEYGRKYLARYPLLFPLNKTGEYFFRYPAAGKQTTIIHDAINLANSANTTDNSSNTHNVIAAATNRGLRFYSPTARSWYKSYPVTWLSTGTRLHRLENYLISTAKSKKDFEITFTHLDSIQFPTSLSSNKVTYISKPNQFSVSAYTVHPKEKKAAYITTKGRVMEWQGGSSKEILPPNGSAPLTGNLQHVFDRSNGDSGYLMFTNTKGRLFGYNLSKRYWWEIESNLPSGCTINIEKNIANEIVTAKEPLPSRDIYLGFIKSPGASGHSGYPPKLRMKRIFSPSTPFNQSGQSIIDVQQRDGTTWIFVLKNRIKYYNPGQRQWTDTVSGFNSIKGFYRAGDRGVVLENDNQTWWIAREKGSSSQSFSRFRSPHSQDSIQNTALDNSGNIWQLLDDGKLYKYSMPRGREYSLQNTLVETPFMIDTPNVLKAFKWGKFIIFETKNNLRILDTTHKVEPVITGDKKPVPPIRDVLYSDDYLFLKHDNSITILNSQNTDRIRRQHIPDVSALLVDENDWLWTRVDNTWYVWLQNEFRIPAGSTQSPVVTGENTGNDTGRKRLTDKWPELSKSVVSLPDGRTAFAPITALYIGSSGELMAQRPDGPQYIDAGGSVNLQSLPSALDTGWLKWDRPNDRFLVNTPTGMAPIDKQNFEKNGKLLFEDVDALLAFNLLKLYAANSHGILIFNRMDLSLSAPDITFIPVQWPDSSPNAIHAAHGCFYCGGKRYDISGSPLPTSPYLHRFSIGDVTFTENLNGGPVSAQINVGNRSVSAFATNGFTWDRDRKGIFYNKNNQLLIHSDAGFHPADSYSGFRSRLEKNDLAPQQTWSTRPGQPVPQRITNPILVNDPIWKWQKNNGSLDIQLKGQSFGFKTDITRDGFGFTSDRLLDAVAYDGHVYVMTEAFLEVADSAAPLQNYQATRYPFASLNRLEVTPDPRSGDTLFLYSQQGNYYWDTNSNRFRRVNSNVNPFRKRLLAATPVNNPRIRFTRDSTGISKEVRVQKIPGSETWVPFRFTSGAFPMDIVNSAVSHRDHLYIATAAGLQVYPAGTDTALVSMQQLYDLQPAAGAPPAPILKVGIPLDNPNTVMARSWTKCMSGPGDGTFQPCNNPSLLDKRLRLENRTWRFIHRSGNLEGNYKEGTGKYSSNKIIIRNGRFPHDRIKDIAIHDGRLYTMWFDGWISEHPTLSMTLNDSVINQDRSRDNPYRFIQIPRDIAPGKGDLTTPTVSTGLYFESRGPTHRVFRLAGNSWQEVIHPGVRRIILDFADKPPIMDRANLRLRAPALVFEHRTLDGTWNPLPWESGRVTIDRWSDCVAVHQHLWAATPAGLTSFTRTNKGEAVLDPNHFIIIRDPFKTAKIPEVTDISVEGNHVTLRYDTDSANVFEAEFETPLQQDTGLFKPVTGDPFAQKEMVSKSETGYWEWHLKGKREHNPGWLEARFLGDELRLVGGRFEFDTLNSLAFFQKNRVEIGTDHGGWYQVENENFSVSGFKRPADNQGIDYTQINQVLLTRRGKDVQLGLRTQANDFFRLTSTGGSAGTVERTSGCIEFLADDGFWSYQINKSDDTFLITSHLGRGGRPQRVLQSGRFTDDIVLGLPVSAVGKDGLYYLVPTKSGVISLNKEFVQQSMYVGDFPGLQATTPSVLYIDSQKEPYYVGSDGLRRLDGTRDLHSSINLSVPGGATIFAVEAGPQDFVKIRWRREEESGWSLVRPGKRQKEGDNIFYFDVSHYAKYVKNRSLWGNPDPWLQVKMKPKRMEIFRLGKTQRIHLDFQQPLSLLAPVVCGKTLYLIGKKQLLEVDLDHVMVESMEKHSH